MKLTDLITPEDLQNFQVDSPTFNPAMIEHLKPLYRQLKDPRYSNLPDEFVAAIVTGMGLVDAILQRKYPEGLPSKKEM